MKFKNILASLLIAGILMPQVGGMEGGDDASGSGSNRSVLTLDSLPLETSIPAMRVEILPSNVPAFLVISEATRSTMYGRPVASRGTYSIQYELRDGRWGNFVTFDPERQEAIGGNVGLEYIVGEKHLVVAGSLEWLWKEEGGVFAVVSDRLERILDMPTSQQPSGCGPYSPPQLNPHNFVERLVVFSGDLAAVIPLSHALSPTLRRNTSVCAYVNGDCFQLINAGRPNGSCSFELQILKGNLVSLKEAQAQEQESRPRPQVLPETLTEEQIAELNESVRWNYTSQ